MWQALAGDTRTIPVFCKRPASKAGIGLRPRATAIEKYLPDLVVFHYIAIEWLSRGHFRR
jgi:hypothetical protein